MELTKEIIGRSLPPYTFHIERNKIREFCLAIGETNPLYLDPEAARAEGYEDTPIPPTFQTVFQFWGNLDVWDQMRDLGIDTERLLHLKEEYTYLKPLYPGETIQASVVVEDVKTGKMNMVTFRSRYSNKEGETCIEARMTIVIRPEGS